MLQMLNEPVFFWKQLLLSLN